MNKKWSNERMMEDECRRMKWRKAEGLIERKIQEQKERKESKNG